MKTTFSRLAAAFAVVLLSSFAITGCGPKEDPEIAVSGVSVSQSSLTMEPGGTANLTATVSPSNATDKTVTWSTSNQSVATVSGGTVTAVGEGTATITATASGKTASCTVTVNKKVIAVTSVALDKADAELEPGATLTLAATVKPDDATDKTVTWISSDDKVAMVKDGVVTAVAAGTATITATASGKTASCTVTVNKKVIAVTSVTLDKTEAELKVGEEITLTATVKPDDVSDKTVSWTTSSADIAKVDNGKVIAVAVGEAIITATAGGKEAACKITVKPTEVESIELDQTEAKLETGGTLTLTAAVKPDDATEKTVEWTTSDAKIATVENGIITAVAEGTVTITAKAGDKTATCTVTVEQSVLDKARRIMEKVYEAWGAQDWKEPWIPGETWPGLDYDPDKNKVSLLFKKFGIEGDIPECITELGDLIWYLSINDEPGVTGSIPESFADFTALESFGLYHTSITYIPDIFAGMPLKKVSIQVNDKLSCPLPYSIGDSPELEELYLHYNRFTGHLPASWARLGDNLRIYNNCLTGAIPREYWDSGISDREIMDRFGQKRGYGLDATDIDFRAEWDACFPKDVVTDLEGNTFTFDDVIKKNKLTVFLNWAPWCPFSKELMPQLRDYYAKYHKDGLEIIATVMFNDDEEPWDDLAGQKKEVAEKGYGQWYNFYWDQEIYTSYYMSTPRAEVYDSEGFVQFSGNSGFKDPIRDRLNKTASYDLIPFLETVFGPAEEKNDYVSTDYSKDGQVLTLQKASVGKGINIVFLGDGYTDKDMASGGLYERVMRQSMEEFFAIEPYKTFRNRFNVYSVKAVSKNGWIGEGYTTALGTTFVGGQAVRGNDAKCYEYALKVPSITKKENLLVSVMLNTKKHAGTTAMSESLQSSVAYVSTYGNDPELFGSTLRHEAGGHGFAFLADEYVNHDTMAPAEHIANYNRAFEKYGWYSNVDFTDDPSKIRWSAFLNDDRYKDEVGIFKGGALYGNGAWRPSQNSMMNMSLEYYNAPSRWAIYQRIMKLSGEQCTFEKFLEYDAVNRGNKQSSAPRTRSSADWQPTAPPVIVP